MKLFRHTALATCVISSMQVYAQSGKPEVTLNTMVVTVNSNGKQDQATNTIIKNTQDLSKQMIQDSRDLVRHETGVSVVEVGRFGASGYAIRGVDENRVAINIDGLRQAESLTNQGFKELFEGYGNFNNTRNGVEVENLRRAIISKGADSVKAGSGALGGAVSFETKDARDHLSAKNYYMGYKTGLSTADDQKFGSLMLAGKLGKFDALLVATRRNGHETKNHGYHNYDDKVQGKRRNKADPYRITQDSILTKLSFNPSENHRFTITGDTTERISQGYDFSYNLKPSDYYEPDEDDLRHTNDRTKRNLFGFSYENSSPNLFWDAAKISFNNQKITTKARTDDYCDGNALCKQYENPYGLQLKDGKVVDAEGNPPKIILHETKVEYPDDEPDITRAAALVDAQGKVLGTDNLDYRAKEYWFDCSVFDCTANIPTYHKSGWGRGATLTKKEHQLDKQYADPRTGKIYATSSTFENLDLMVFPKSNGFSENLYTDRDLNTDTKQLNLDFNKSADIFGKENRLSYGISYAKTNKEMINHTGYHAINPTWWANSFLGVKADGTPYATCEEARADTSWGANKNYTSLTCPTKDTYSFLIPVAAKDKSLYLMNKIFLHDRFSLDLGYRRNKVNYKPNYIAGQTAKIPDDMVKGLFVPLPENNVGDEPRWWNYDSPTDPNYLRAKAEYDAKKTVYDKAVASNPDENIAYFSKEKSYSQSSYSVAGVLDMTDNLRLQAKYAQGFRMPTVDEMYFTFQHPDLTVLPNVNLKPEQAKNKELALTVHGNLGFITTSVFRTNYQDFIDFDFVGNKNLGVLYSRPGSAVSSRSYAMYQSQNRDNAKVDGVEVNANFDMGSVFPTMDGFNMGLKHTRQHGRINGDIPMNAIQPRTSVFGLGYDSNDGRIGGNLYITHVSAKEPKDTYNMFYKEEERDDSSVQWRSDKYTTIDLTAYYKPNDKVALQAGIYNLTNKEYLTWDSARSIRSFGTSNMIDQKTGQGISRFYAPERNFKLSAEIVF